MKLISTVLFIIVLTICSFAQADWTFQNALPADSNFTGLHGVAVDGQGRIWLHNYTDYKDSIMVGGTMTAVAGIRVYNPDGTPAAFSPIFYATVAAQTDTLCGYTDTTGSWIGLSCRGLRADANGDILVSLAEKWPYVNERTYVYKLSQVDGSGLAKLDMTHNPKDGAKANAACGVATSTGNIFTGYLYPLFAVQEYDANFNLLGTAIQSVGYTAAFDVSADGNTIYWPPYGDLKTYVFNRPDEFSAFALVDSMAEGCQSHGIAWQPVTGYLWLAASGASNAPYTPLSWYAFDPATKIVVDSIRWDNPTTTDFMRGLAFSADGFTAYAVTTEGYPGCKVFTKTPNSIGWEEVGVIGDYRLSHNYPNPFNPTTDIKFSIGEAGYTTFTVYNLLGQEVATLISDYLKAGEHKVTFDASALPSGVYIYKVKTNGKEMSKKMTLIK